MCSSDLEDDKKRIVDFFLIDLWRRRENAVFLFTADHDTSLKREKNSKLTTAGGSMMNQTKLEGLLEAYKTTANTLDDRFSHVCSIDTSFCGSTKPSFQRIAYVVADTIVDMMKDLGTQLLLVTERVGFEGFKTDEQTVRETRENILRDGKPTFMDRQEAESSNTMQQVVPYALLRNAEGRYFLARRRADLVEGSVRQRRRRHHRRRHRNRH